MSHWRSSDPGWHWAEAFEWEKVEDHIYKRSDGKYHFEDECSQFDETPYLSVVEAKQALTDYVENYLK